MLLFRLGRECEHEHECENEMDADVNIDMNIDKDMDLDSYRIGELGSNFNELSVARQINSWKYYKISRLLNKKMC